jgi:hypothetical protein
MRLNVFDLHCNEAIGRIKRKTPTLRLFHQTLTAQIAQLSLEGDPQTARWFGGVRRGTGSNR